MRDRRAEPVPARQPLREPSRRNDRAGGPEIDIVVVDVDLFPEHIDEPVAVLDAVTQAHVDGAVRDVTGGRHESRTAQSTTPTTRSPLRNVLPIQKSLCPM